MKKLSILIIIILLGIIGFGGFTYYKKMNPTVDTSFLKGELVKASELTTAKLTLKGITTYDNNEKMLKKTKFVMEYKANVRAGINLEDVVIESDPVEKIIYITIPEASILEVKVDNSSIKYYDQQSGWFNGDDKIDADKAKLQAEQEAGEDAKASGIIELANEQSETLIKGILANAIPDGYTIIKK